jgi:rare lipoprotein A
MTKSLLLISLLISLLLSACSSDRYQQKHDSTPTRLPSQAELKDAIPRAEAYSRGGNKDYQVFGKPYKVLANAHQFEQVGIASWYGKKFHGHLTSNGEIYDMYTMSAAHKNLPLPTYLTVTNLANNKSVIVRVNDRGPFHQSRIIDLSYSAAYKLDMLKKGTAKVKITAITHFDKKTGLMVEADKVEAGKVEATNSAPSSPADKRVTGSSQEIPTEKNMGIATPFIQVLATSNKAVAISTAKKLAAQYKHETNYPEQQGLYRIQIGPINDLATLNSLLTTLKTNGYPNAYPRSAAN